MGTKRYKPVWNPASDGSNITIGTTDAGDRYWGSPRMDLAADGNQIQEMDSGLEQRNWDQRYKGQGPPGTSAIEEEA